MNTLEFFADINSDVGHQLLSYGNMVEEIERIAHELDLTRDRIGTDSNNCVGFLLHGEEGDLLEFLNRAAIVHGKHFELLQYAVRRNTRVVAEEVDPAQFGNRFAESD